MKVFSAKHAQTHFSDMLITVIKEPVTIEKHGKPSAVMISCEDYKRFEEMEDHFWYLKVKEAEEGGYATPEESEEFLANLFKDLDSEA